MNAMRDLRELCRYLEMFGALDKLTIDLGFVQYESYYSGIVLQGISKGDGDLKFDCLAVGGRYDNLVSVSSKAAAQTTPTPTVGISLAIDKLISREREKALSSHNHPPSKINNEVDILVCSVGNLSSERIKLVSELWSANLRADTTYSENPTLEEQVEQASQQSIPWIVILKEKVYKERSLLKVKNMEKKVEVDVPRSDLVKYFSFLNTNIKVKRKDY